MSALFFLIPQEASAQSLNDSVVKVFVAANKKDYQRPWQTQGVSVSTGSGSVIENNQILTNAHVISGHTFVQVKRNSDSKKYTAKVSAIGQDCDLAILTVDDPDFFKGAKSLEFGGLPVMQDEVTVLGYPQGGGKISTTRGIVSRIELVPYSQSARTLLSVQIDAAINPGNSGGPVIKDGKIVGVAMQALQSGQNIGYMIPVPIIKHFFEDIKDGQYDGFPMLGLDYSTTENPTLRRYYNLKTKEGGVLVSNVLPFSSAQGYVQEDDVILKIEGVAIGEDGTFLFRKGERLGMPYLITQKQVGEVINLEIIREGKKQTVRIPLQPFKGLVAYPDHYKEPPYYIFGGLVFTVLSTDLLMTWGGRWWETAPQDLTYYLMGRGRINEQKREDLVVLLHVLSDNINIDYEESSSIIKKVNGAPVSSFKQFVNLLEENKGKNSFTVIETEPGARLVFDNTNIDKINQVILRRNNIAYPYSSDVKEWIERK